MQKKEYIENSAITTTYEYAIGYQILWFHICLYNCLYFAHTQIQTQKLYQITTSQVMFPHCNHFFPSASQCSVQFYIDWYIHLLDITPYNKTEFNINLLLAWFFYSLLTATSFSFAEWRKKRMYVQFFIRPSLNKILGEERNKANEHIIIICSAIVSISWKIKEKSPFKLLFLQNLFCF